MAIFNKAEWIWAKQQHLTHEYADFWTSFEVGEITAPKLRICAKTDYAVWLNGKLVGFNQYHDFPDEKVYDEYDISQQLKSGENTIAALSLAYNKDSFTRIADGKGIIFEVENCGKIALFSSAAVVSRLDPCYKSGDVKQISDQMGDSFEYDFSGVDNFTRGDYKPVAGDMRGFLPSVICSAKTSFAPRPIKRLKISAASLVAINSNIYDLGREVTGYLSFSIFAAKPCDLIISFGEHLIDGEVRRKIGTRDFSVVFHLASGENEFDEYFLRFGLRYLQLECKEDIIKVESLQIREAVYPLQKQNNGLSGLQKSIYDVSAVTLQNCMHEHYEDCPWREQAQYTMDSRSEMLCGYYAFKEYAFPRACLKQMIHYLNDSGYIPMTTPTHMQKTISAFNMVFFLALKEYVVFSGDTSVITETQVNCKRLLGKFINRMQDFLLPNDPDVWNFFEWSDGLEDNGFFAGEKNDRTSLPLNCWFIIALDSYAYLLERVGENGKYYSDLANSIRLALGKFLDKSDGFYYTYLENGNYYHKAEYSQFIALYAGIVPNRKQLIQQTLQSEKLVPMSLSSYIYRYQVLLSEGGYDDYVMSQINQVWGQMLSEGATTFWETTLGAADFCGAGSLCHGWSAIPIFVYHNVNGGKVNV